MESLYVCLFSNGHIKVGRSVDPTARMASHADRVSCLGIELSDSFVVECVGPAAQRESRLIALCIAAASTRHHHEWFSGLDFLSVCEWARECASESDNLAPGALDLDNPNFQAILRFLRAHGIRQMDIAAGCRCSQPSISDIATGRTKDPTYSIGAALIRMARALMTEAV